MRTPARDCVVRLLLGVNRCRRDESACRGGVTRHGLAVRRQRPSGNRPVRIGAGEADGVLDGVAGDRRGGDHRRGGDSSNGRSHLRPAGDKERLEKREPRACVAALRDALCEATLLRVLDEAGRERAPRSEEQRLDSGLGEIHLGGDLAIGKSLPLSQQKRALLLLGHVAERLGQADQLVGVHLRRRDDVLERIDVARRLDAAPACGRTTARQADVVRNFVQPRHLELGPNATLQSTERVQERRLDRVFRFFLVPELVEAVRVNLARILLIEPSRGIRLGRRPL